MSERSNTVPESVPLHQSVLQEFHQWKPIDNSYIFSETRSQFLHILEDIADGATPASLDTLTEAYKEFQRLEHHNSQQAGKVERAKQEYRSLCDQLPPVSWENWDQYRDGSLIAPKLSQVYSQLQDHPISEQETNSDDLSRVFKALPHILEDPQCILPDDAADDDIHIEGGQIELTCPITCMKFEKPMVSRKCGHVFDYKGIQQYLNQSGQQPRDCPQAACRQKLTMRDFVPDKLMEFRCKIANARDSSTKLGKDLVTL
ncbi:LAFE_0F11650g1_1 [Lachancea fermentati]|uniref:LAFE_0F11650g1_1 n=1 Tax=Lachancea fermentati TaxID=4955 RepID=A0A1G4MFG7_LACFM|nr:LAFE_0F11650g1_1 [Lachancea fermentati]